MRAGLESGLSLLFTGTVIFASFRLLPALLVFRRQLALPHNRCPLHHKSSASRANYGVVLGLLAAELFALLVEEGKPNG
jgi:hypothetical protein